MKNAVVNLFVAVAIVLFTLITVGSIYKLKLEHKVSNRSIGVDTNNLFKIAYINFGGKTYKKVVVSSWRDFPDGDECQVTDANGITYLTHYNNIILMSEDPDKK